MTQKREDTVIKVEEALKNLTSADLMSCSLDELLALRKLLCLKLSGVQTTIRHKIHIKTHFPKD